MKILVSMNSFKGCLSALESSKIVVDEIKNIEGVNGVDFIPLVDGGTGSLEAWAHLLNLSNICCSTVDPVRNEITAPLLIDGKTAYIEMALASGIHLANDEVDLLLKDTYGTGLLIREAIKRGCTSIYLGLGGSATHDLGTGILQALGVDFYNDDGQKLVTPRELLGFSYLDSARLRNINDNITFTLLCDVQNTLTGAFGAAHVFAPQKGAYNDNLVAECEELSNRFVNYFAAKGLKIGHRPGDGAAGGIPALLGALLNAKTESGVSFTTSLARLKEGISSYDLVISGEGQFDEQSFYGKGPGYLIELSKEERVPVIILTGSYKNDTCNLDNLAVFSIIPYPALLEDALKNASRWLAVTARNAVKLFINGYQAGQ